MMLQARLWRQEKKTEEQIAEGLHFKSVEHMYRQMQDWGWPDWAVYPNPPKTKRRAKGSPQPPEELPPANAAAEPLAKGIKRLNYMLDALQFMRQWLKDKRFVTELDVPEESERLNLVYRKEDYRPRSWARLCKEYGQDPSVEEFRVPFSRVFREGAYTYPHQFPVSLITAYTVTGGDPEDLVGLLHPKPEEVTQKELKKRHAKLLLAARHLATVLRGGVVKEGRTYEPISPDEHEDYWELLLYEQRGWPTEELELSPDEQARIRNFRLPGSEEKP